MENQIITWEMKGIKRKKKWEIKDIYNPNRKLLLGIFIYISLDADTS